MVASAVFFPAPVRAAPEARPPSPGTQPADRELVGSRIVEQRARVAEEAPEIEQEPGERWSNEVAALGEQARIVELLVERVDLQPDGIDLRLRIEGLTSLCSELRTSGGSQQEAA